jgi:hypothetical protein
LSGCKKDEVTPGDAISDFYGFLDQMKASSITYMIQSYYGPYSKPEDDFSQLGAYIIGDREPLGLTVDELSLFFPDYNYSQDSDFGLADTALYMAEFYGKLFGLKFTENSLVAKSDGSISNPEARVYIPKLFYPVTYENLGADEKLTIGTTVKWNKDDRNENGVLIKFDYYPSTQSDLQNRINYPEYIRGGKIVEDIGEYTFGASDFVDVPPNADLHFSIERVGITNFTDKNGDDCSIAGLVISAAGYTISIAE